jgi:hypothetical protein
VSEEPAVVAQGSMDHLRELRAHLHALGIRSQMVRPPEGRGSS